MMQKYAIGESDFESIIEGGFVYVDKTAFIHRLIENGKFYFLSRPRRFGKSLLLSTIEYFFRGKRELFENLAIHSLTTDWNPYPVLRIDLTQGAFTSESGLENRLSQILSQFESKYEISAGETGIFERFGNLIQALHNKCGRKVVVLVDEYDKPILDCFGNEDLRDRNNNILRNFYSVLKSEAPHLKFVFLTGITRFGHLNIFSGLNNLNDISLDDDYSAICGITEKEMSENLLPGVKMLSEKKELSVKETIALLKSRYDGYHFSADSPDVYNPFSLLQALSKRMVGYFWYSSGTPKMLLDIMKRSSAGDLEMDGVTCTASMLQGVHIDMTDLPVLMYQTGYLTIKSYDDSTELYTLGFPNYEVRKAFSESILLEFSGVSERQKNNLVQEICEALNQGDVDKFIISLKSFLADIPYEMNMEKEVNFQLVTYSLFQLLGFDTEVEHHTSSGRIDVLIKTSRFIYIIELKINSSAAKALSQIENKKYVAPFMNDGRTKLLIGINFSTSTRTVADCSSIEIK